MLNWYHNWRRNCKGTHRTISIHLLSTERLSGTSVSTRLQSSYLHLKVFPSVSLHKLLSYSNSMKGKWKIKKYAFNIWQRVIKEEQFWELSLWHFLLAFHQGDIPSLCLDILYPASWNQKEKEICSSAFEWLCKTQQYKRQSIFHYTVMLEKKTSTKQNKKNQKNHPKTITKKTKNPCCWCLNGYIFTCWSPTIFLNFLICKNKIGKNSH